MHLAPHRGPRAFHEYEYRKYKATFQPLFTWLRRLSASRLCPPTPPGAKPRVDSESYGGSRGLTVRFPGATRFRPRHDRLCWLSQQCADKWFSIRDLKAREIQQIPLAIVAPMTLEIDRRDLPNRVCSDAVCWERGPPEASCTPPVDTSSTPDDMRVSTPHRSAPRDWRRKMRPAPAVGWSSRRGSGPRARPAQS
jgi:hypothetical protein